MIGFQHSKSQKMGKWVLPVAWIFSPLLDCCYHLTLNHLHDSQVGWILDSETDTSCLEM